MTGERLEDLFRSSAESRTAVNAVVESEAEAAWLFTYCGASRERDHLAAALRSLGPLAPFEGRPSSHTHELEDASRNAGCTVLYVGTHMDQACLAACLVGEPARIFAHVLAADAATGHVAQAVHARRVELGSRPDRPKPASKDDTP